VKRSQALLHQEPEFGSPLVRVFWHNLQNVPSSYLTMVSWP
ncbi:unnamed protein product, partial [Acidithrix sp. C25]